MLQKLFHNADLDVELTSFIDNKQNVWFQGKDIALILGYNDTTPGLRKNVSEKHKTKGGIWTTGGLHQVSLINAPGFYELVFGSKLPTA